MLKKLLLIEANISLRTVKLGGLNGAGLVECVWSQRMKLVAYMVFLTLKGKLPKSILKFSPGIFCLKGRLTYKMETGMVWYMIDFSL